MLRRPTLLGSIALGLGAMHLLPAKHHISDFLLAPSVADAWKGFGAAVAVVLLLLPLGLQARIARNTWKPLVFALVAVHLVPAADHIPKLLAAPSWGDAWRALGASVAVVWFSLPRGAQLLAIQTLTRPTSRPAPLLVRHVAES